MRITAINLYHLACQLSEPQGNGSGWYDRRSTLIVEVQSENGLSGWGETWHSPLAAAGIIRESLGPAVLGLDCHNATIRWQQLTSRLGYERRGVAMMAISAIEMAATDLIARAQEVSVSRLLGGRTRDHILVYAAGPYFKAGGDPYRNYERELELFGAQNFRAAKLKVGVTPTKDASVVERSRKAMGSDFSLMVDVNQGYTPRLAIDLANRLAPYELQWLEEPVLPDNREGYRAISAASSVPIAGGEALAGFQAFHEFLAPPVFDVVQPDVAICGGPAELLRIAALAHSVGVAVVPHVWGSGVSLYYTLQLLALLPAVKNGSGVDFPWLEMDRSPNPFRELWGEPPIKADGTVDIPDHPGTGISPKLEDFATWLTERWSISK